MAHDRWTEVEARGVLDAWRKSGWSLAEFARRRGIGLERLYTWRRRLDLASKQARPVDVVPVRVAEPLIAGQHGTPLSVILRSGHAIKVARGFDEETFRRVVALLERA